MQPARRAKPYEIFSRIYRPESRKLPFLDSLTDRYGLCLASVLDLGCGTGALCQRRWKNPHSGGLEFPT